MGDSYRINNKDIGKLYSREELVRYRQQEIENLLKQQQTFFSLKGLKN